MRCQSTRRRPQTPAYCGIEGNVHHAMERMNLEIRRRKRVFGIFAHPGACLRLIDMLLVEKHEDWLTDDKAYLALKTHPWMMR
jgi:hypothetical protein